MATLPLLWCSLTGCLCAWCSLSSFPPQGLCTDTQVPTYLCVPTMCTCAGSSTPVALRAPAQPAGITPYLQFRLLAGQVIPQKVWPQDWWDSLGSYGQCPCPHLGVGTAHVCVIWSLDSLSQRPSTKEPLSWPPPRNLPLSSRQHSPARASLIPSGGWGVGVGLRPGLELRATPSTLGLDDPAISSGP